MHVVCICTTYNRNTFLRRALRSFLEQDYTGLHTLLVFNSGFPTSFPELDLPENKRIILINRDKSLITGKEYSSVGAKYIDALSLAPECDIITSYDVDDIFLSNHISEGVKGMEKALKEHKLAYKPKYSYFKSSNEVSRAENVFEPSIFVDYTWIKDKGYHEVSVKYHDKWLIPLIQENKILVDSDGVSTFIYDWSGQIPVYKMSGRADTELNFFLSQTTEKDTGIGTTFPSSKEEYNSFIKI